MGLAARSTVNGSANGSAAWVEFELNSLHHQALARPDRWIGIWTSADEVRRSSLT